MAGRSKWDDMTKTVKDVFTSKPKPKAETKEGPKPTYDPGDYFNGKSFDEKTRKALEESGG